MAQKSGSTLVSAFKSVYNNEYQWSFVKSIALFVVGVKIAQECAGMEIMPSIH